MFSFILLGFNRFVMSIILGVFPYETYSGDQRNNSFNLEYTFPKPDLYATIYIL